MTRLISPSDELRADRRLIVQVTFIACFVLVVLAAIAQTSGVVPGPETYARDPGPITAPADPLPCTSDDSLKLAAVRNPAITCPGGER